MRSGRTDRLLFPEDPTNKAIARRFQQTFRDRKIARHLMYADADERESIEMALEFDPELTLYDVIELHIRHPRKD